MAGMPRRLFLTHVAALPFGCLSVPSAVALENAAAAASAPSPVPAVRPGGFVDHEGWILPVGDRDAIIAATRRLPAAGQLERRACGADSS